MADGKSPTDPPGGGGGGGSGQSGQGAAGAPGYAEMIYTVPSGGFVPSNNVIRFIVFVPPHGGNNNRVLMQVLTNGTVATLNLLYVSGGKFQMQGYNAGATKIIDSGAISFGADGQTLMMSMELATVGSNVTWVLTGIIPGNRKVVATASGSVAGACGAVSEVTVDPNGDITKTALGHISVQYALIPLTQVSKALNGYDAELTVDRFIRLANEQALGNAVEFSEGDDHFGFETTNLLSADASGFETATGGWTALPAPVDCTLARSTAQHHSGAACLAVTCNAQGVTNGYMSAISGDGTSATGLSVVPNQQVACSLWVRTAVTARSCNAAISWWDNAGNWISDSVIGVPVTDSTSAWTQCAVTDSAPGGAYWAFASVYVYAAASSEVHYIDDVTLGYGSGAIMQWTAANATLSQSSVWKSEGTYSMLITANGAGQPSATYQTGVLYGTNPGLPLNASDHISVACELYAPAGSTNSFIGVRFYDANGNFLSEQDSADTDLAAGVAETVLVRWTAPTNCDYFSIVIGEHATKTSGWLLYADNVRVHPVMGVQTAKDYASFLKEIHTLDQGILKEAKALFGLGYRTRLRLISQAPQVTLDYAKAMLTPPLAPVVDDKNILNDVTVHRVKGSKVRVSLLNGAMSVQEPPAGTGKYAKTIKVVANDDVQLLALANHLLNLGTVTDERYPTITVNLLRCSIPGNSLAPLMSAVAQAECGDYVQIINLPFWYPSTTTKQLIIGYTENLSARQWDITWNCAPESPWEITATSIRRW